jgi:hypothetical protein
MGSMLGMLDPYVTKTLISASPLVSVTSAKNSTDNTSRNEENFIITCPSIPINGYVGEAGGGGQSFPVLGVGRVLGLVTLELLERNLPRELDQTQQRIRYPITIPIHKVS